MGEPLRHFRFIRPIASGGFGTVYLCKEEHRDGFSRIVAVKLLNAQWTDSVEISSRIRDEARLLGMLRHRNIVDAGNRRDGLDGVGLDQADGLLLESPERFGDQQSAEALSPLPQCSAIGKRFWNATTRSLAFRSRSAASSGSTTVPSDLLIF